MNKYPYEFPTLDRGDKLVLYLLPVLHEIDCCYHECHLDEEVDGHGRFGGGRGGRIDWVDHLVLVLELSERRKEEVLVALTMW